MAKEEEKQDNVTFVELDDNETVVDLSPEKTEKSASDDRLERAERELSELRTQLQSNRQQNYGNQPTQQSYQNEPDEMSTINERERALGIQWEADKAAGRLKDSKLVEDYDKKAREIAEQRTAILTRKAISDMMPSIMQQNQAQYYRQQYSDVYNNNAAVAYARGEYQKLLALGETDSPQLVDKAMNAARIQFKMPGSKGMKPTDRDREQLSGISGSNNRQTADNTVKMGKAEKSMAMAMYGKAFNGDEKKVYAKWASTIGIRAKKSANKRQSA
jgi:hypothetical protein